MGNSVFLRDLVLHRILLDKEIMPGGLYISLHSGDPGVSGANEIQGGGYNRLAIAFTRSAPGAAVNIDAIEYEDLPRSEVTHFGIWDARIGGNYLTGGTLLIPQTILQGQSLRWRESDLTLRVG